MSKSQQEDSWFRFFGEINLGAIPQQNSYFLSIAGLRAIAVLVIFLFHINPALMPGGFVGVDIFFVISGFVVANSVLNTNHASLFEYYKWFYKRRMQRILPASWVYILIITIIGLFFIPSVPETRFFEPTGAAAIFGLSNVILYLKSGDYFAASSELNPFTHTWSLAVEEQYYLIFPFLSYMIFARNKQSSLHGRLAIVALSAVVLASFAAAAVLTSIRPTFSFYMLPTRFWELGIGFLLRIFLTAERTAFVAAALRRWMHIVIVVAVVGLLYSIVFTKQTGFPFPGAIVPCMAAIGLIAIAVVFPENWFSRLLSGRSIVAIGNMSYSIYLWHWGVIVLMRWTCGVDTLAKQLIAFCLTMLLAWLSYRYVELFFHNDRARSKAPTMRMFASYGVVSLLLVGICFLGSVGKPVIGLAAADGLSIWNPYEAPPDDVGCPTRKVIQPFGAGMRIDFAADCVAADAPHLYLIGDSHAGAYQRAAWKIAASGRWRVELITLGGCRFIYVTTVPDIAGCRDFLDRAARYVRDTGKPGDVVLLPGLQTARFVTDDGSFVAPRPLNAENISASRKRLADLAQIGLPIIVEGPKPLTSTPAYRCADWFNRDNPVCRPSPDDTDGGRWGRMVNAREGISEVTAGLNEVRVWEPSDVMCRNELCPAQVDGKPWFFDTDHLSAYGNDVLLPSLLAEIEAARQQAR